jgi:hypothetical protein
MIIIIVRIVVLRLSVVSFPTPRGEILYGTSSWKPTGQLFSIGLCIGKARIPVFLHKLLLVVAFIPTGFTAVYVLAVAVVRDATPPVWIIGNAPMAWKPAAGVPVARIDHVFPAGTKTRCRRRDHRDSAAFRFARHDDASTYRTCRVVLQPMGDAFSTELGVPTR